MTAKMLSAYLWDLRAQCEQQVRALADAQAQLDTYRDSSDAEARQSAVAALRDDLGRVVQANGWIRHSADEAITQAQSLASAPIASSG
jgi:hypothetical protein